MECALFHKTQIKNTLSIFKIFVEQRRILQITNCTPPCVCSYPLEPVCSPQCSPLCFLFITRIKHLDHSLTLRAAAQAGVTTHSFIFRATPDQAPGQGDT